jgi:hypothetical protein
MKKEDEMIKVLRKHLENMTEEQKEEMREHFRDKRPKGWLSIEGHLPMMFAGDIMQGYSIFKVRDKTGKEFDSAVSDHHIWYYRAKDEGVTHWLNE